MNASPTPRVLAIVPARGGSKGVPRKNLRVVGGKPLIVWTLETARAAGALFADVVVSTDDPEIARVSQGLGVAVPFRRPPELATDDAPIVPVLQQATAFMEQRHGRPYDWICWLSPVHPLRGPQDVIEGLSLALSGLGDTVIGVTPAGEGVAARLRRIENERLLPFYRTSDGGEPDPRAFPPALVGNAGFWMVRREVLMLRGSLAGESVLPLIVPAERALEIASELDLDRADLWLGSPATSSLAISSPAAPYAAPRAAPPLSPVPSAPRPLPVADPAMPQAPRPAPAPDPVPATPAPALAGLATPPTSDIPAPHVLPPEIPLPRDSGRWLKALCGATIALWLPLALAYAGRLEGAPGPFDFLLQGPTGRILPVLAQLLGWMLIAELASWTYGLYDNLRWLSGSPRSTPAKAAAGLTIPILNLIAPLRIFGEIWRSGGPRPAAGEKPPIPLGLPLIWLAFFAGSSLHLYNGLVLLLAELRQSTAGLVIVSPMKLGLFTAVAEIVVATGLLLLVPRLHVRQEQRWSQLGEEGRLPPAEALPDREALGPRHAWRAFFLFQLAALVLQRLPAFAAAAPYAPWLAMLAVLVVYGSRHLSAFFGRSAAAPNALQFLALPLLGTLPLAALGLAAHLTRGAGAGREMGGEIPYFLLLALVPALEETLFRGLIFEAFCGRFSRTASIFLAALLFATLQTHPAQMVFAFVLGLACGLAKSSLGVLWAAILVHACSNLIAILHLQKILVATPATGVAGLLLSLAGVAILALRGDNRQTSSMGDAR